MPIFHHRPLTRRCAPTSPEGEASQKKPFSLGRRVGMRGSVVTIRCGCTQAANFRFSRDSIDGVHPPGTRSIPIRTAFPMTSRSSFLFKPRRWPLFTPVLCALGLSISPLSAEPQPVPLSIEGLVSQTLARNPEIRYYEAEIAVAGEPDEGWLFREDLRAG